MNNSNFLKRLLVSAFLLSSSSVALAGDVGVSISIGQPGFYGRIDIGDYPYPMPRVIYSRPIIIHRHHDVYEPIYLRVPPGHAKNWRRYCGRYDACSYPVYFVQDSWYHREYVPIYRERHDERYRDRDDHGWDHGKDRGKHKGHGKNKH